MEERVEVKKINEGILYKLQQYEENIEHIDAEELADICMNKIKTKANI